MSRGLIIYTVLLFGLIVLIVAGYEDPVNWKKTYSRFDKNPYGSYALAELIPDLFPTDSFASSNQTIYEILESKDSSANIVSISTSINLETASLHSLLKQVSKGNTAFISAQYFNPEILDTLGFSMDYDNSFHYMSGATLDSAMLRMIDGDTAFFSRSELQISMENLSDSATVLMVNESNNPVMARFPYGNGHIIVNTTPILFSNFFILFGNNHQIVSAMLSYLPNERTIWTEYYQTGKFESTSPFREVLKYPPLKNALYLTLALVFLYLIFESKRAQRAIPVMKPLSNMTLDFVKTVGSLYFQRGEHKSAAQNKINYLRELVRNKYNLQLQWDSPDELSAKTGVPKELVGNLFNQILQIEQKSSISATDLIALDQQMAEFYKKTQHRNVNT